MQHREGKADDLAIVEGTNQELKGGRRFLVCARGWNLAMCNPEKNATMLAKLFMKIRFTSKGENRFDFYHPSLESRIKKIDNELKARNIQIDRQEEDEKGPKMVQLMLGVAYFIANNRKLEDDFTPEQLDHKATT